MKYLLSVLIFSIPFSGDAQRKIDILHYQYDIDLNDKNDTLEGQATIQFVAVENTSSVSLDLATIKENKGMAVTNVRFDMRSPVLPSYTHESDKLFIAGNREFKKGDTGYVNIFYKGIPADGLIISRNKYGKRTFFSDNWPNRAHNWIPCVDDPADKASVEFVIVAPSHYKVVSNGVLVAEKELSGNKKLTHWKEEVPLPTKIMVIGMADFAVDTAGVVHDIPVTSWVFPENKNDGFYDYAQAKDILAWFIDYAGPFPYKKLANVQSKTIFGGMENAGAIFYHENSVTGNRKEERLIAHEIAHQWFGDMVTEKNFSHLWLSEGFATYLANVYLESKYGIERMVKEMKEDRRQVIDFVSLSDKPVVDTVSPYMQLLNANSYQKGGWILHMLRQQLGDSVFHAIIRKYYASYAGKNADTKDFRKICEQVSGKRLEKFFRQWLYTPGLPKLKAKWEYHPETNEVLLTVEQLQKDIFEFPLDIELKTGRETTEIKTIFISKQKQQFNLPVKGKPEKISLDPATSLLFDGTVTKMN